MLAQKTFLMQWERKTNGLLKYNNVLVTGVRVSSGNILFGWNAFVTEALLTMWERIIEKIQATN